MRIIEGTRDVVEVGAYWYIRHPLYASLMFFTWGVFLKKVDWTNGLVATPRSEEAYNHERFGVACSQHVERTTMFILFVL